MIYCAWSGERVDSASRRNRESVAIGRTMSRRLVAFRTFTASTTTIHHNNGNFPDTRRFPDCSVIPGNPSTEYSGKIPWGSNETKR